MELMRGERGQSSTPAQIRSTVTRKNSASIFLIVRNFSLEFKLGWKDKEILVNIKTNPTISLGDKVTNMIAD